MLGRDHSSHRLGLVGIPEPVDLSLIGLMAASAGCLAVVLLSIVPADRDV